MLSSVVLTVGEHLIKHRFYANYMQRAECWCDAGEWSGESAANALTMPGNKFTWSQRIRIEVVLYGGAFKKVHIKLHFN